MLVYIITKKTLKTESFAILYTKTVETVCPQNFTEKIRAKKQEIQTFISKNSENIIPKYLVILYTKAVIKDILEPLTADSRYLLRIKKIEYAFHNSNCVYNHQEFCDKQDGKVVWIRY